MLGTIKRLVSAKGFGFIQGEDGKEYFFHNTEIKNGNINMLDVNDNVEFEGVQTAKGMRANNVYLT